MHGLLRSPGFGSLGGAGLEPSSETACEYTASKACQRLRCLELALLDRAGDFVPRIVAGGRHGAIVLRLGFHLLGVVRENSRDHIRSTARPIRITGTATEATPAAVDPAPPMIPAAANPVLAPRADHADERRKAHLIVEKPEQLSPVGVIVSEASAAVSMLVKFAKYLFGDFRPVPCV